MASGSSSQYSFRIKHTSYKSQDLIYEELGYQLVIYLEMCGDKEFYWGGVNESFEKWTIPVGEPISQRKREEIIELVYSWSRKKKTPIKIGPAVTREEDIAYYEAHGYRVLHLSEKSYVAYPSDSVPPVVIKEEEVADYETRGWFVQAAPSLDNSFVAFASEKTSPSERTNFLTRILRWFNKKS